MHRVLQWFCYLGNNNSRSESRTKSAHMRIQHPPNPQISGSWAAEANPAPVKAPANKVDLNPTILKLKNKQVIRKHTQDPRKDKKLQVGCQPRPTQQPLYISTTTIITTIQVEGSYAWVARWSLQTNDPRSCRHLDCLAGRWGFVQGTAAHTHHRITRARIRSTLWEVYERICRPALSIHGPVPSTEPVQLEPNTKSSKNSRLVQAL